MLTSIAANVKPFAVVGDVNVERRRSCLCHTAAAAKRRRETPCRQAEPRQLGRICTDVIAVCCVHLDAGRTFAIGKLLATVAYQQDSTKSRPPPRRVLLSNLSCLWRSCRTPLRSAQAL